MTDFLTADRLAEALAQKPRRPLAALPTRLQEAPTLSERLGVRLLIKRDDETGLALGGNKARKLEYLIADALTSGADAVVTTGGSQSNHARMTAAACRHAGLSCYLVLDRGLHPEPQGNLLLDALFDAEIVLIDSQDPSDAAARMDEVADELRAQGRRPYLIPRGGSTPVGAAGYAAFAAELLAQLESADIPATHLYLATGSCGTHSGVLAGLVASGIPLEVQGISVSRDREQQSAKVLELSNATLRHLGLSATVQPSHVQVDDGFRGPGYGHPTPETWEAVRTLALDEGILLDPVYTGKAMAGLMAHARAGRFRPDDVVVFLHTGGAPALFAYQPEVLAVLNAS